MKEEADIVQRKEVKAILFDMDGVLVDSLDAWYHVFNHTLRHFGLKTVSKNEFKRDFGAPIEHVMKKYFKGKTAKEVVSVFISNFKKNAMHVRLFPQSLPVLKSLKKKKMKMGLITNSAKQIVHTALSHFHLKSYFNVVVTMDDVKRRKPAPDMVLKACSLLEVKPRNTILVGDTKNDMIAGRRAGCITVGYKIKGDFKVNNLKRVIKIIQNENTRS